MITIDDIYYSMGNINEQYPEVARVDL